MPLQIQISSNNKENFVGSMKIMNPDLVFLNLIGMSDSREDLFKVLIEEYSSKPVLCFGNERELSVYSRFLAMPQFTALTRPMSNHEILAEFKDKIGWHVEQVKRLPQVMFIDDDPVQLRTMRKSFKEEYDVLMATSGEEALFQMETKQPDIIFLDYEMPGVSGKYVLEQLRESENLDDIPVYFLTSVREREKIVALLDLKPAGYLLKPAKLGEIRELIEKTMGKW